MIIINETMKILYMIFAFMVNTKVAISLIRMAYIERGGWGVGSEYILIIGLLVVTFVFGHKLFKWMDRKITE